MPDRPTIAVVISTKNRPEDLSRALASVFSQSVRAEVVVVNDGSTDGTAELLASFGNRIVAVNESASRGYIVQRNRLAALATSSIIVSIDDDAEFSDGKTLEKVQEEFDHPRIGAVAMPYIDVHSSPEVRQRAPNDGVRYVAPQYKGTAHALRRDVFVKLGGYREQLFHQGEERDYCARLLDSGFVVRLGSSPPVLHYESPRRDFTRMDLYGRRNDVLFACHNVPWPYLPAHLAVTTANGLRWGLRAGRPANALRGLARGYKDAVTEVKARAPIKRTTYRLLQQLRAREMLPFSQVAARLGFSAESDPGSA